MLCETLESAPSMTKSAPTTPISVSCPAAEDTNECVVMQEKKMNVTRYRENMFINDIAKDISRVIGLYGEEGMMSGSYIDDEGARSKTKLLPT